MLWNIMFYMLLTVVTSCPQPELLHEQGTVVYYAYVVNFTDNSVQRGYVNNGTATVSNIEERKFVITNNCTTNINEDVQAYTVYRYVYNSSSKECKYVGECTRKHMSLTMTRHTIPVLVTEPVPITDAVSVNNSTNDKKAYPIQEDRPVIKYNDTSKKGLYGLLLLLLLIPIVCVVIVIVMSLWYLLNNLDSAETEPFEIAPTLQQTYMPNPYVNSVIPGYM